MATTAASASILGLIVFGTLASLLGKIGNTPSTACHDLFDVTVDPGQAANIVCDAVYELSGEDFHRNDKLFRQVHLTAITV